MRGRGPQGAWLAFADRPEDAPILHFRGPLTLRVADKDLIVRDGETELYIEIGTPGLGDGTFVTVSYMTVPQRVHPEAEIEFPTAAGPVREKVVLNKRC